MAVGRKLRPALVRGCVHDRSRPRPTGQRQDVDIPRRLGILSHEREGISVGCDGTRNVSRNRARNPVRLTAAVGRNPGHAPPALDSRTYTADYNESRDVGRATDTSRTAEQSATALFWSPSASALWTANIRSLARSMDLLTAARFEAIGTATVVNALIAAWDAKYTYMFWRPVTAIRAGDSDGNGGTEPDPAWTPFIATPPHPEYPAAHTTVGGSVLGFYTVWFGTDRFPLRFTGNGGAVRDYASAREIHAQQGCARERRDRTAALRPRRVA